MVGIWNRGGLPVALQGVQSHIAGWSTLYAASSGTIGLKMNLSILPYALIQRLIALPLRRLAGINKDTAVDEAHPANSEVLQYLRAHSSQRSKWALDFYVIPYVPRTSDELEEKFSELSKRLPEYCGGECYGYPVLVYPDGGVIFAVASGQSLVVIRLPQIERKKALSLIAKDVVPFEGSEYYPPTTMHASEFGKDWVFVFAWHDNQRLIQDLLLKAYDFAGELSRLGKEG